MVEGRESEKIKKGIQVGEGRRESGKISEGVREGVGEMRTVHLCVWNQIQETKAPAKQD